MQKLLVINPRSMSSQLSYVHHFNYLAKNANIQLYLICESADKTLFDKSVSVLIYPRNTNRLVYAYFFYRIAAQFIIDNNINWVISCYGHFNSLLALFLIKDKLSRAWEGYLFYDLRSASVSGVLDRIQNLMYSVEARFYDKTIAVSQLAANKVFGFKRASETFILGVGSISKSQLGNEKQINNTILKLKTKYDISQDTIVFIYIGTLAGRQLDIFIKYFDFDDSNYCFLVIGDGDKNSEIRIKNIIKKKELTSKVHLLGRLPVRELPAFLTVADVGVAYTQNHRSLNTQPFTKIQEYAEFKLLVLASDNLSANQYKDSAEVIYLSQYDRASKVRSYIQSNKQNLYKSKKHPVYWTELSRKLLEYLSSHY